MYTCKYSILLSSDHLETSVILTAGPNAVQTVEDGEYQKTATTRTQKIRGTEVAFDSPLKLGYFVFRETRCYGRKLCYKVTPLSTCRHKNDIILFGAV